MHMTPRFRMGASVLACLLLSAIGVLVSEQVAAPDDALDVDRDGRRDVFEHCATGEGVRFRVRSGAPGAGGTLWSGYYYLGYDVEADCPDTD